MVLMAEMIDVANRKLLKMHTGRCNSKFHVADVLRLNNTDIVQYCTSIGFIHLPLFHASTVSILGSKSMELVHLIRLPC